MSSAIITLLVLLGVGLLLALWLMSIYNGLVVAGNRFENAFAQIDVQLKRRYDLIPQPGRGRQGLHGPRERDARGGHQGPQQRDGGWAESRRNPGDPAAMRGLNDAEAHWAAPWAGSSPWPKPTRT